MKPIELDHIFIFSKNGGDEANSLIEFGFVEGSSRVHPKQGTRNRKFYFENFFVEILWVYNETEIRSELISKTGLFDRSRYFMNDHSRFGMCLMNSKETDNLFQNAETYQPSYFPEGVTIDILTNSSQASLPWTFRLPEREEEESKNLEPIDHPNGIRSLSQITFGYDDSDFLNEFVMHFEEIPGIDFAKGESSFVILEFDEGRQNKSKIFKELDLVIRY